MFDVPAAKSFQVTKERASSCWLLPQVRREISQGTLVVYHVEQSMYTTVSSVMGKSIHDDTKRELTDLSS